MNAILPTVRLTATCASCGTENQLTLTHVHEAEAVGCSHCGAHLGNVGELLGKVARPAHQSDKPLVPAE